MNTRPVAGTFRLDGMLQGPLPPGSPVAGDMAGWVSAAGSKGLVFHLSTDGGTFSIVADPSAQKTARLGSAGLSDLLEDALNSFLDLLPGEGRARAFSTVRSEEFRPGTAVQTLYSIGPDGLVSAEQRQVDAETGDPPPELTAASIRRALLPSLLVLFLGLFISSFFIDYRKLFSEARDRVVPVSKEEVTLDLKQLGSVVEVELTEVDNKRSTLVFNLKRGADWEKAVGSKPSDASGDWNAFLIYTAVHQRRLRVELFNKEGELLGEGEIRLDDLHKKESAEVAVVARWPDRPARVVVRP
jgi:hypothetical protein